jgi:(1->4)-alpha-D-glucan 1-alpha-D-glucosylmutase
LNYIERFLLLDFADQSTAEERARWTEFVMRFQQLTGPLMAKGAEDTAFYVYNRLLSLNEVGGEPDRFGRSVKEFHNFNQRRGAQWPHAMNASATHDTKRGEDARVRINVLSELPAEWEKNLRSWSRINRSKKIIVRGAEAPDRNDEYFLYQTLIGSYPSDKPHESEFEERLTAYLIKAVREAKVHTEWLQPDTAYEKAFIDFVRQILGRGESQPFMDVFIPFAKKIAHCGMFNSLAQVLLKIASPGVPDIYQGTELWDLSFVDPDNRRPVDYGLRRRCLEELREKEAKDGAGLLGDLLSSWPDGRIKLYLMHKLLDFRRAHQELFAEGDYVPLEVGGESSQAVCAFARRQGRAWAVVIAPLLVGSAVYNGTVPLGAEFWKSASVHLGTEAPTRWLNIITGEHLESMESGSSHALALSRVLNIFPVAFLYQEQASPVASLREENLHAADVQHSTT